MVPVAFRQMARTRCTELAEWIATQRGEVEVSMEMAMRAMLRGAAFFMRDAIRDELLRLGLDVTPFADEFVQQERA